MRVADGLQCLLIPVCGDSIEIWPDLIMFGSVRRQGCFLRGFCVKYTYILGWFQIKNKKLMTTQVHTTTHTHTHK